MNAPVTRRALLGATAAVGVVALPAIAEAALPTAIPIDPDAELLDLVARWTAARGLRRGRGTHRAPVEDLREAGATPPRRIELARR